MVRVITATTVPVITGTDRAGGNGATLMACSPSGWGTPPTPAQTIGLLVPVPVIATWRRRRRVIISRPTIKLFGQADELGSGRIIPGQAIGQS